MLNETDYCDYETCVALEEVGMLLKTQIVRSYAKEGIQTSKFYPNPPSLYEAQKWLREEKGIIVEVFIDDDSDTPITYNIHKNRECVCHHHGMYWSVNEWEAALLEGIKEAVKILKDE